MINIWNKYNIILNDKMETKYYGYDLFYDYVLFNNIVLAD